MKVRITQFNISVIVNAAEITIQYETSLPTLEEPSLKQK